MEKKLRGFPCSVRYVIILGGLTLTFYILIVLQSIFMPLLCALIISILLKPICNFFERFKFPKILSTLISMLIMLLVLAVLVLFIVLQFKDIDTDISSITEGVNAAINKLQKFDHLNYIKDISNDLIKSGVSVLQNTLSFTVNLLTHFLLFLIGVFFFLYYRIFLKEFLFKIIKKPHHVHLANILQKIQHVVRRYLIGFISVLIIVAILNSIGLWALQIKHALFFGILGSILLIIPYIGITIGAILPTLFTFATTNSFWRAFGVLLVFWAVQFLEGNFITPYVVGKQVSLNAFAVLLVLFLSGKFFGLMGIILAIPVLAILKVIFDEIKPLQPLGFLLGTPKKISNATEQ
ncbi:MAG: AI-2E family transporter [Proteobacteria bacterium]|nr:AI-2E family transporter [Pseudomonadota bacterium]